MKILAVIAFNVSMASKLNAQSVSTLRLLAYRLQSTPVDQLPRIVPSIANALWSCRDLLAAPSTTAKQDGEIGVVVHRFKTQLNTLLQDRTSEGRWSAIVLVKATIEAGGVEVLSKSNNWVKALLGILKKSDPSTVRTLAIITLTRIFMLTWDFTNLIREITTPALPSFVSSCLSNIETGKCSTTELQTILEAFATLVPRHPTIFRTNETQIRNVLTRIVSSASSPGLGQFPRQSIETSYDLIALLHYCAPKQGAGDKWDSTLKASITAAHQTCDRLYRSVIEDWRSTSEVQPSETAQRLLAGELELEGEDAAGLKGWYGVHEGSERLITLLEMLTAHISSPTATSVNVRVGWIADLLSRVLGVVAPPAGKQDAMKLNPRVSKEERDALFNVVPGVHLAAFDLVNVLLDRFGSTAASFTGSLLDHVLWVSTLR